MIERTFFEISLRTQISSMVKVARRESVPSFHSLIHHRVTLSYDNTTRGEKDREKERKRDHSAPLFRSIKSIKRKCDPRVFRFARYLHLFVSHEMFDTSFFLQRYSHLCRSKHSGILSKISIFFFYPTFHATHCRNTLFFARYFARIVRSVEHVDLETSQTNENENDSQGNLHFNARNVNSVHNWDTGFKVRKYIQVSARKRERDEIRTNVFAGLSFENFEQNVKRSPS